ncbi:MAG: DUF4118 domain-containing protein [Clostridia bacterium]|nr:DUF4118 domain-containing protein [Clostridia bacterium]
MNKTAKKYLKNSIITLGVLAGCFGVSLLLHELLQIKGPITAIFVFGVFLISLTTDGYIFGLAAAFISVFAVNFAFAFPYFSFNFAIPENFVSALVMIVIALMTSTLISRLKAWQEIRAEGERERMRANLLRAVSHDLRTPLTTIYGSSSAILDSGDNIDEERKKRIIAGIKEDSEWLIRMVENLLSVTRIDSGSVEIIKTPTVLYELVDTVILKFKKRYPDKQVEIDIPEELVMIPMDAMLIGQVIINLLENAVQHAQGMTKLEFRVFVLGDKAIFEVKDNGCGIEQERLDKIFDGYFALNDDRSDTGKRNAGIGLSVCSTIIKAHGGRIKAENAKDGGAIFRFSLNTTEDTDYDNEKQ